MLDSSSAEDIFSNAEKVKTQTKNFRVFIRICPPDPRYHQKSYRETRRLISVLDPKRIAVDPGRDNKPSFQVQLKKTQGHPPQSLDFDAVCDQSATQKEVYESTAKPLVDSLLQGYNGCVITFGPAASGKTFTMLGRSVTGKQRGILSRAAEDIFNWILDGIGNAPEVGHCKIRASFIQISNEKIYDLLESQQPAELCRLHEVADSVVLDGLKEVEVDSSQGLLQLYRTGSANRHAGISKGELSSMSHVIFNIVLVHLKSEGYVQEGEVTTTKLTLVDLGSSGKVCCSGATVDVKSSFLPMQGNPPESKSLKRSLATFGNVIFALSTTSCQYVPYRESKLTRILRDCLGGNCLTSLIVALSAHRANTAGTLNSLRVACRAMAIPPRPVHRTPLQLQNQPRLPPILPRLHPLKGSPREAEDGSGEYRGFLPHLDTPGSGDTGPNNPLTSRGTRPSMEEWTAQESSATGHDGHTSSARSSPSSSIFTPPTTSLECPNCARERRIREEYDKILVEARRDRDMLRQRVALLEGRLKEEEENKERLRENESDDEREEQLKETEEHNEGEGFGGKKNEQLETRALGAVPSQHRTLTLGRVLEVSQANPEGRVAEERTLMQRLGTERSCGASEKEELRAPLGDPEREVQEAMETKRCFQDSESLAVARLQKDKAELMSHMPEIRGCHDKVSVENSLLRERDSKPLPDYCHYGNTGPSHVHTVTTNTEMLLVSHHVSQQCSAPSNGCSFHSANPATPGTACGFNDCHGFQSSQFPGQPTTKFPGKPLPVETPTMKDYEQSLQRTKDILKQLRRERSLLLDMMLILYRREWLLEDAVPYVRRTLYKCGLRPDLPD